MLRAGEDGFARFSRERGWGGVGRGGEVALKWKEDADEDTYVCASSLKFGWQTVFFTSQMIRSLALEIYSRCVIPDAQDPLYTFATSTFTYIWRAWRPFSI